MQCKTAINRLCAQAIWFLSMFWKQRRSQISEYCCYYHCVFGKLAPIVLYEWLLLVPDAEAPLHRAPPPRPMPVEVAFGLELKTSSTCICCRARRLLPVPGVVASQPQFPQPLVFKSPRSEIRFDSCLMQCRDPEPRIHGIPHLWSRSRFVLHCHCRWEAAAFRGSARSCQRFKLWL